MIAAEARAVLTQNRSAAKIAPWIRKWISWVEHFLAATGLFFLIFHLGFELIVITSGSMAPALQGESPKTGDRILVERVTRRFRNPRRWEVYYFYDSDGVPVAKRIVGLPGERIRIQKNQVEVNGKPLSLPLNVSPLKYYPLGDLHAGKEANCGDGYYVLGDDSADSYDSRFLGPVARDRFIGRAWLILSPRSRAGFVN